jgi:hypothetical protein
MRKEKLGRFGPNIIQLLNEWADMFPYDFRDERMMKKLKEITQRILAIYPELRSDVTNITHALVKKVCYFIYRQPISFTTESNLFWEIIKCNISAK